MGVILGALPYEKGVEKGFLKREFEWFDVIVSDGGVKIVT
jgi:hypothetical protein